MDAEGIGHDIKVTGVGEPYLERSLQAVICRGDGRYQSRRTGEAVCVLALRACVEVAAKSKSPNRVTSRKAFVAMTVAQCPTGESTE